MVDTLKQRIYVAKIEANGKWTFENTVEEGSLFIETIQYSLPLSNIYKGTGI
jgi:hypothetical protein